MLYQMVNLTGEYFDPDLLERAPRAAEFFNLNCEWLRNFLYRPCV